MKNKVEVEITADISDFNRGIAQVIAQLKALKGFDFGKFNIGVGGGFKKAAKESKEFSNKINNVANESKNLSNEINKSKDTLVNLGNSFNDVSKKTEKLTDSKKELNKESVILAGPITRLSRIYIKQNEILGYTLGHIKKIREESIELSDSIQTTALQLYEPRAMQIFAKPLDFKFDKSRALQITDGITRTLKSTFPVHFKPIPKIELADVEEFRDGIYNKVAVAKTTALALIPYKKPILDYMQIMHNLKEVTRNTFENKYKAVSNFGNNFRAEFDKINDSLKENQASINASVDSFDDLNESFDDTNTTLRNSRRLFYVFGNEIRVAGMRFPILNQQLYYFDRKLHFIALELINVAKLIGMVGVAFMALGGVVILLKTIGFAISVYLGDRLHDVTKKLDISVEKFQAFSAIVREGDRSVSGFTSGMQKLSDRIEIFKDLSGEQINAIKQTSQAQIEAQKRYDELGLTLDYYQSEYDNISNAIIDYRKQLRGQGYDTRMADEHLISLVGRQEMLGKRIRELSRLRENERITIQNVTKDQNIYSKTLEEQAEKMKPFTKFGIQIQDPETGKLLAIEDIFINIADAYNSFTNAVKKEDLRETFFGQFGKDMLPLLNMSAREIRKEFDRMKKDNLLLTDTSVKAMDKFMDRLHILLRRIKAFGMESAMALKPFFLWFITGIENIVKALTNFAREYPKLFKFLVQLKMAMAGLLVVLGGFIVFKAIQIYLAGWITTMGFSVNVVWLKAKSLWAATFGMLTFKNAIKLTTGALFLFKKGVAVAAISAFIGKIVLLKSALVGIVNMFGLVIAEKMKFSTAIIVGNIALVSVSKILKGILPFIGKIIVGIGILWKFKTGLIIAIAALSIAYHTLKGAIKFVIHVAEEWLYIFGEIDRKIVEMLPFIGTLREMVISGIKTIIDWIFKIPDAIKWVWDTITWFYDEFMKIFYKITGIKPFERKGKVTVEEQVLRKEPKRTYTPQPQLQNILNQTQQGVNPELQNILNQTQPPLLFGKPEIFKQPINTYNLTVNVDVHGNNINEDFDWNKTADNISEILMSKIRANALI